MLRRLVSFLSLYDVPARSALYLSIGFAAVLACFDFASLVVLYPVFGALAAGSGSAAGSTAGPLDGIEPSTLIVVALALMVGRSVLGFLARMWWGYRAARAEVTLASRLLRTYAYAPYAFHLRSNSSDLLGRAVSHVNMATATGLSGIVLLSGDLAASVGMTVALFFVNPLAAAVISGYLGLMGAIFLLLSKRYVKRQADDLSRRISHVYSRAANVLRGIRELTVANGREVALGELDGARAEMARTQRNLLVLAEVPRVVLEVALYAAILLALSWVLRGENTEQVLPVVALYVVAGLRILPAVSRLLGTVTQIRTGFEIGDALRTEMLEIEAEGEQAHRSAGNLPAVGDLAMERVDFSYGDDAAVLSNVSVTFPRGTMVGIVGPSGSGKTTLLGLLLGLLVPGRGQVTYGGADVGVADPSWLAQVAYVPQDVFVVDDTVLANVCLGDSSPDEQRALVALRAAKLDAVVADLPDGLWTRLQEGGARLSVGQRQRLGIARALYREAKVLLLDEPTAALDSLTESQVVETLIDLRGDVTMIVVAHRIGTLDAADQILRLENGKLVADR